MRGATSTLTPIIKVKKFQSTLLMRGATCSSHSFRRVSSYFNPRSSCEERLRLAYLMMLPSKFQSTLLMRGATVSLFYIDSSKFHTPFSRTTSSTKTMSRLSLIGPASLFLCDTASHSITKSWVPQDHRYFLLQCVLSFLCSFSQADRSVNCLYVNQ